jgi:hypothetical protein
MKNDKFTEYIECELALGREGGWEKEIKAKEALAWAIHTEFPPTGSLLLAHLLLQQKTSYLKQEIKAKAFAKPLSDEAFEAVQRIEQKDGWDYYWLGLSHLYGRGVAKDYLKAAEAFTASHNAGNLYAEFEIIWARHLAGGSRLEALLGFIRLKGKLADFAALSARALALVETGPVRVPGSPCHIARILLLHGALHDFIYHDLGSRHINIAIEKELREGAEQLLQLNTPRAYLALYLTERTSRANPTGQKPIVWFEKAIDPTLGELEVLCRTRELSYDELRIIVKRAGLEGWSSSSLASIAASALESPDD